MLKLALIALALACSAPEGRFLLLASEHVHGSSRVCVYEDALGSEARTVGAGEMCEPYLELDD